MKRPQKQGENTFIEAHTATKRAWVMVLFIFFTLFLVGSVSALEIDNVKSYNEETKTATIINAFNIPLLRSDIAKAILKTPHVVDVGKGNNSIAEFIINPFENYTNLISTIKFYDLNDNGKEIQKEFYLKYKDVIITDVKNETGDFHFEEVYWKDLEKTDFINGENKTIRIYVDVQVGDHVEWVPTIAGVKVNEWAEYDFVESWSASTGSTGIATDDDGEFLWFASPSPNKIYKHWLVNGTYANFNPNTAANPYGVAVNGTHYFAIDLTNTKAYGYSYAGGYVSGDDIDLNAGNGNPRGACIDVNILYVADITDNLFYRYWTNNQSYIDTWIPGGDNGDPNGCAVSGNFIWVTDDTDDKVYKYLLSDFSFVSSGSTDAANTNLLGIASNGTYFWTTDLTDGLVYKYDASVTEIVNITLNSPADNFNFNITSIIFNGSVNNETDAANVSLIINSSYIETNSSGLNGTDYIFSRTLPDGNHNWTMELCLNSGLCANTTTRFFTIDTTFPLVNITFPLNTTYTDNYTTSPTVNISLNWTVSDTNLDSCWYYNTTANVSITCGNNATINLPHGSYNFIVYANDSVGHLSSSNITATWDFKLLQNSITFNENASELSNEEFKINISSTGEETVTSNIVYNGTSYSANKAGYNILMEFSRTIPIYAGNNSFYWSFNYGSEIINSSTYFQNVSETNLANCTTGTKYFNLLLKDEKTIEFLNNSNNISIETVFTYYINDISVNKTFVNSFSQNSVSFCMSPPIENIRVFGEISYNDETHVKERHFILFENFTNSTTINITLFDLATPESTSFLVFTESEGAPFPNVYMKLKRQYLNLNVFVVVEMAKADSFGQTVLHFVTEDEIYRIEFYDEKGVVILETQPFQAVCIDNVCSMSFKVDPDGGIIPPFEGISPDGNLVFSLSLVGNDTAVLLTYTSTNGSAYNLQMKTAGFSIVNDTVIVCIETETNTISGSLSCNISSFPFTTYVTELWIDDVLNDIQYSSVTNDAWKDFGNDGILYTILIIMALTLMLIYVPELCVMGSIAGVLISAKLGFIPMTYVSGMYLVVAGIIIIYKMRKN